MIDEEVQRTAQAAYKAYLQKNLPLLDNNVPPARFQQEVERTYAIVLNGETLEGNKKPGDDEAKSKMHIKTMISAARVLTETVSQSEPPMKETFYSGPIKKVFLFYLDKLHGSSIDEDEHSIFTDLTKNYEGRFMQDVRDLNVLDPDELTRVTEYGPKIIKFVEEIIQKQFAYATPDGSVYFDIEAFEAAGNKYARLEPWNRNNQPLLADGEGQLTNKGAKKRSRADFALWKASQPGEPSWSSPWGRGRPGWHIECSAMASDKLGKQIDIHSGGIDLAFPHHDNELAQSEAYWYDGGGRCQWVNYFMHMGHLSISGSKMSKSLKNFTTIREALTKGTWTSRSLRIIFLLGGWREGIEITDDLVKAGSAWEDKLTNFFLRTKDLTNSEASYSSADDTLASALKAAQGAAHEALLDSFNTPGAMNAISELVSQYNNIERSSLNLQDVLVAALWLTSMVNIFGLNGAASPEPAEIGWDGIDIPKPAKPYVYPLSRMRDSLRKAAKAEESPSSESLKNIVELGAVTEEKTSDTAKPYADILSSFRVKVLSLEGSDNISKDLMALCDRVRDIELFDLGIYLEDRENQSALVRPASKELIQARQEKSERARQKQLDKEKKEEEALQKAEKGKLSHLEMFRTKDFREWDGDGLPTKDAAGEEITKSRGKKLRKDWERQKKLHEAWLVIHSEKTTLLGSALV